MSLRLTSIFRLGSNLNLFPFLRRVQKHIACYKQSINRVEINRTVNDASKEKIISLLNFQAKEDTLPFYNLSHKTLLKVFNASKIDANQGVCKNRLYYLSERLKCPPAALSECVAKRTFIYTMSFDWLQSSLNILLDMGVTEDRILRDLWVLKYHPNTIEQRLKRVKIQGIDNLYPWMVRCSEDILQRYISICQETKTILGDTKSTQLYLANRLNTSSEYIDQICFKIPALKTIRATKVKVFLDFLIKEGFQVKDIATKPRVLSASQNTVKERLEKLRNLGIQQINLNVLCRSKKDFKKYCESIESVTNETTVNTCINSNNMDNNKIK